MIALALRLNVRLRGDVEAAIVNLPFALDLLAVRLAETNAQLTRIAEAMTSDDSEQLAALEGELRAAKEGLAQAIGLVSGADVPKQHKHTP